ncbi:MAG: TolC family protein [Candidatus Aminicenantes bacterium]|nr:TolC family protein [Candidatus Aminicenantes bacterium]
MKIRTKIFFLGMALAGTLAHGFENKQYSLDELIRLGIENSPTVAAQLEELQAKNAAYQASKRLINPELEFHYGDAESYDGLVQRDTTEFSVHQPLENPFKRHHRIQVFKNGWQAGEYLYRYVQLEVIADIKTQFYLILLFSETEKLAAKTAASIKETHKLIVKRAQLGEVKELEAIKLRVEMLKAENELNKIMTELRLAKENLNKSLGNILPPDFDVKGEFAYTPLPLNQESILNAILPKHPLIQGKKQLIEKAESEIRFVKWQRLPDFKLTAFSKKELDGKNQGFGVTLDIPLWNWRSKEIAVAENLFQKQSHELKKLELELSTEVSSRINRLKLSERTIHLFTGGLLEQAEESLKISETSYKHGEISLIDYLDSQRTYYSILKDYQNALYAWNAEKAALEKTIGEELE